VPVQAFTGIALSNYGILIGKLTGNSLPLKPKRGIKSNAQLIRNVCGDIDFFELWVLTFWAVMGKFCFSVFVFHLC
jgi:hypothetical protein